MSLKMPMNREDFEYKILSAFKIGIKETCAVSGITLRDEEIENMVQDFAEQNSFKKCYSL